MRWGFALVVVISALAIGSVHTTVLCIVAVALAGVAALAHWDARPLPARGAATIVVATGIVLLAWTFLQQIPLPIGFLRAIAPANADIWSRALTPLKEPGPSWAPITLDPIATRVHLLRGVVLVVTFLAAARVAARTGGVKFLERVVLASALIVGAAALIHPALGLKRVFGVFEPETASFGTRVAPLLNSNHLAAYLNLGACVALAWALSRRTRVHWILPFVLYLILVGIQVVVASRGGVAATSLGSVLVIVLTRRAAPDRPVAPWYALLGGVAAVAIVGSFVLQVRELSASELTSSDTVKLSIIRQSFVTLRTFPWVGLGRGAFEGVFPAFRSDGEGNVAFTHPENIVVQWGSEWGIPIGLVALAALTFALRPATALARSSVPVGPASGLLAVGAHNFVDFSAEIPGVAIALATFAGCVCGGAADVRRDAPAAWWLRAPRATAIACLVGIGVAIGMAAPGIDHELLRDRAAMRDLATKPDVERRVFVEAARAAMLRHPAEPYLPLMGAVRATRAGDENPIPWIARTLERASVYGRAHLLLARLLHARSPAQARLEYRLAMEQDYNLIDAAIREGAQLVQTGEDALQLVPDDERLTDRVIQDLATVLRPTKPEAAERLDRELARRNPGSTVVARLAVEKALAALADATACENRPRCMDAASVAADHYRQVAPRECASHRLAAEVMAAGGHAERAFIELDRAIDGVDDPVSCAQYLLELAMRTNDNGRVSIALERLLSYGCSTDQQCVTALLHAAKVEEDRKNIRRALAHAKRASEHAPERNDVLALLARLTAASGDHAEALQLYLALQGREPQNRAWADNVATERAALDASRRRVLGLEELAPRTP